MPHKKRTKKNHIQVKQILRDSELSLLDKKKGKKSFERVPRRDNLAHDRQIEARILNDDDDDLNHIHKQKRMQLKKHINQELQTTNAGIPKKSRRNKYFLMNHPEMKDVMENLSKAKKRKHEPEQEEEQEQPVKKKMPEETKPSICDKLVSHMITSRFRYLNEKLYTSTSSEARKLFEKDPQSFHAYHQGYSVSSIYLSNQHFHIPSSCRRVCLVGLINLSMISSLIFVNVLPI